MDIKMNATLIKKLREDKAWSQEHLAAAAGVSLRTIQRVECEGRASAETRLALASALGVEVSVLSADEKPEESAAVAPAQKRISWQLYRRLRLLLVAAVLVGMDIYRNGSLTWTRWVLLAAGLLWSLRWLRSRFVAERCD